MLAPEQPLIQQAAQRYRALLAERKLRRHDEWNSRLVQRVREAGSRDRHRTDVAAVATRHRHDRWTAYGVGAHRRERAGETLARHDIRRAVVVAQHESVDILRRLVAMR